MNVVACLMPLILIGGAVVVFFVIHFAIKAVKRRNAGFGLVSLLCVAFLVFSIYKVNIVPCGDKKPAGTAKVNLQKEKSNDFGCPLVAKK